MNIEVFLEALRPYVREAEYWWCIHTSNYEGLNEMDDLIEGELGFLRRYYGHRRHTQELLDDVIAQYVDDIRRVAYFNKPTVQ